jgi:formylglycine-generating enzyme required for sulfatase activity
MNGNVWEWTSSGASDDYSKNRSNTVRVFRGGSWDLQADAYLTSSIRGRTPSPYLRGADVGFRCAR